MNEGQRQTFLFVATLAVGMVLVFFDIPVLLMLGVLVVVGLLFLFMTGAVTPADLSSLTSRLRRPKPAGDAGAAKAEKKPRSSLFRRKEKEAPMAAASPSVEKKERQPLFAGLAGSLRGLRAGRERRTAAVKNALAAAEPAAAPAAGRTSPETPTAGPSSGTGRASPEAHPEDPFLTLSDDELQGDLLDDLGGLDDLEMPSFDEARAGPAVELELDSMPEGGDAFDDAAAAILADHANDLEEFTDLEGVDEIENELSSLDEADFADSEIDGLEVDAGEMTTLSGASGMEALLGSTDGSDTPLDTPDLAAEISLAAAPQEAPNEMAAFAAGPSGSERDMLSLLASDSKKVRVKQDLSLLRDLKDVRVGSEEIVVELEGVLRLLGGALAVDGSESPPSRRSAR